MPEIPDDEKMPLSWFLFDRQYWVRRWIADRVRVLFRKFKRGMRVT